MSFHVIQCYNALLGRNIIVVNGCLVTPRNITISVTNYSSVQTTLINSLQ